MSIAIIRSCDFCGKEVKNGDFRSEVLTWSSTDVHIKEDMCDSCYQKIKGLKGYKAPIP